MSKRYSESEIRDMTLYFGDIIDLAYSLTWGGYLPDDLDIVRDLGLSYSVYKVDIIDKEVMY